MPDLCEVRSHANGEENTTKRNGTTHYKRCRHDGIMFFFGIVRQKPDQGILDKPASYHFSNGSCGQKERPGSIGVFVKNSYQEEESPEAE